MFVSEEDCLEEIGTFSSESFKRDHTKLFARLYSFERDADNTDSIAHSFSILSLIKIEINIGGKHEIKNYTNHIITIYSYWMFI